MRKLFVKLHDSTKQAKNSKRIVYAKKWRNENVPKAKAKAKAKKPKTVNAKLKSKAEKSKFTQGQLRKVYNKGLAAYASSGSRKGMTSHQWAMARVNSFLRGGPARKVDMPMFRKKKTRKK